MSKQRLILWKGIFEYPVEWSVNDPQYYPGEFYMLLDNDKEFKGKAYDTEGMLGPAIVSGAVKENNISFEKTYLYYHYCNRLTGEQLLLNFRPPTIFYHGTLQHEHTFEGEWHIDACQINYCGEVIPFERMKGSFKIWTKYR